MGRALGPVIFSVCTDCFWDHSSTIAVNKYSINNARTNYALLLEVTIRNNEAIYYLPNDYRLEGRRFFRRLAD